MCSACVDMDFHACLHAHLLSVYIQTYRPVGDFGVVQFFVVEKDKGRVVVSGLFGIYPHAVSEIHEGLHILDLSRPALLVHPGEHRPEVRAEAALYLKAGGIVLQIFRFMDEERFLHMFVALHDIYGRRPEELSDIAQDCSSLIQELLHQHILTGGRGVDRDHQCAQAVHLPVLVFLNERHIAVHFQSIVVKTVVKRIRIDRGHFPQDRIFSQKFPVVRPAAVGDGQDPVQAAPLVRGLFSG